MTIEQALRIFKALSDKTRLRIFLLLLQSELCVCQMMEVLKAEQSLLSHQLSLMKKVGLVLAKKKGRWVFYQLAENYRQELGPIFEEWFKTEMEALKPKIARAEERVVCPVDGPAVGQLKAHKTKKRPSQKKKKKKRA
ncbi:MAG: winged helix-turn-helix transcriptional regulator [Candidatus Aminicenantes bacterium]|nr:winged helix-turn-helix transcriptional regulator [Candidatus Aminicenantes bacterium]